MCVCVLCGSDGGSSESQQYLCVCVCVCVAAMVVPPPSRINICVCVCVMWQRWWFLLRAAAVSAGSPAGIFGLRLAPACVWPLPAGELCDPAALVAVAAGDDTLAG